VDTIWVEIPDRPRLALDRREKDLDGRLHVRDCRITSASVNPYLGREIPGFESLGLEPGRIYHMYRDAAALKAAAPTFERVPLLIDHASTSADEPRKQLVIGTVSNVRWQAPYLVADLTVWDAEGIEAIESGRQKDLSCGYRYVPEMNSGVAPDGTPFDGRMLEIGANHVAIVSEGRVPNAMVADRALPRGRAALAIEVQLGASALLAQMPNLNRL
jgi:hypothetical protein